MRLQISKFINPNPERKPKCFWDILKWKFYSKQPIWPKKINLDNTDIPPPIVNDEKIRVSFVGHVTFLIQLKGLNILTDPVWADRASPISFYGPKRVSAPGIAFSDLPKIDLILISHNHYDHLDILTLKKLCKRDNPLIITPLMNDIVIKSHIPKANIYTLNWRENKNILTNIDVCLEPAQHWSARGIFDQNKALWGTFIIKTPKGSICFIGDTGYSEDIFKDIGKKYNDILISLIPIGAFEPRWFMKDVHVNPEEAIFIHKDLNSKYSIASHFETFQLADDEFDQASNELKEGRIKHKIKEEEFILPKIADVFWF